MKNSATIESLKSMRFSAMAAELERQIQDPATYAHMGFEERVALLVDAEWNSRQNNKLLRCIRDARFAEPGAAVEDIEYYEDRRLDKAQLLRFATCDFIAKNHHIIFREPPAMARPIWPVPWATPPAGSCCRCGMPDSRSFWRSWPWHKPPES